MTAGAARDRAFTALEAHGCKPKRNVEGLDARCPLHDDRRASLSGFYGEKRPDAFFLKCHAGAGCHVERIVEALGLSMRDLFDDNNGQPAATRGRPRPVPLTPGPLPPAPPRPGLPPAPPPPAGANRIVAEYSYCDETGAILFQAVRYEPKDFRQRRPDGNGGWLWNMKGVRRVLYRLPELLAADPAAPVFIAEGEKDTDSVRALGLVATCNPMGAGKWSKVEDAPLSGRHVVVVPDDDPPDPKKPGWFPGEEHAQDVAARLHGRAASVRILRLALSAGGKDASDFIDERRADAKDDAAIARELLDLAAASPVWSPPPIAVQAGPVALDEPAARKLSRNIFDTQETFRGAGVQLCRLLTRFHDGGGFEVLGLVHKDHVGRTHRTFNFFAGPWGVTARRVRQMIEHGRLLEMEERNFRHLPQDQLSEEHLAAFLPLAGDSKAIETACRRAVEVAAQEAAAAGKTTPRITGRLIRRVVEEVRPPAAPASLQRQAPPAIQPTTAYFDPAAGTPERVGRLEAIRAELQAIVDRLGDLATETGDGSLARWHKALAKAFRDGNRQLFEGAP